MGRTSYPCLVFLLVLTLLCSSTVGCRSHSPMAPNEQPGETIILIRHGEKPPDGLGQLTCAGLNRALALPRVLLPRFGTPAALFAPDPGISIQDGSGTYSYVRPLATLEPTAIQLGLPVHAELSYKDVADLQKEVTAPVYAHSTVLIAWEHGQAERFADLMLQTYGQSPSLVPHWARDDYDSIFVFHLSPPSGHLFASRSLRFEVQQEGLGHSLSATCPGQ